MQKFELRLRRRDIQSEEILADIRAVHTRLGARGVTRTLYDEYGQFGATTVIRRFGSWNKALQASGLPENSRQDISIEELFENLALVWTTLGKQPFGSDMDKSRGLSKFSLATYEKRFGSWNKALIALVEYVDGKGVSMESSEIPGQEASLSAVRRRGPRSINWRLRASILIRDNCICKLCGASPSKDPSVTLHVDHIVPWSRGGETVSENLQTLCSVCNLGKGNADILVSDDKS